MVFGLGFASSTILSCFFYFFMPHIDIYFLIPAVNAKNFIATAELAVPMWIQTKEATAEIEVHPVTADAKISKCSIQLKILQTFLCILLINSFWFISSIK